ncbi:MAG: FtsX-like permease family protein [Crocinitomicaceae bacterium]
MLNKILFKNQDKKQLIIAMIGAFMGITFLVTSIHYLIKVNQFGKGADILGPNTIIVQKKVTNSSSLNLTKTDFSTREIEKIKAESFIQDVKPVISNNFDVSFETNDPLVPYFRSDVFIQTVDQNFLDVKSVKWKWQKGDEFVPMILPRDFLVMLNTFMSASGIPQVSDDLAMDIKFKFRLRDPNNSDKEEHVNAKIIGFTNEVASILVPETFMEYGNEVYAGTTENKITQIMISGKESEFGLVEDLLNKKGLESKNSQMVVGRLKSVVGTLFLVVLGISVIAVFVSGLVLIQYLQLLLSRNAYEVKTLLRMGYPPRQLIRSFSTYFIKIFGLVALIGLGIFFIFKIFLDRMFESGGLYIDTHIAWLAIVALGIAYALFALASYLNAKKGIFNEY